MKIWMVIPAYNEARSLERILRRLKEKELHIIVVDDGSKDSTYAVAKMKADIVLRNEKNLGKGMALRKAMAFLLENEKFDYIITMDGDGQHSVSDIDKFLDEVASGASFVVGNRMHSPIGMPKIRILTNQAMSWLLSRMVSQNIPDTQCGFRLIGREVLEKIKFRTNKFEVESEILIKAAKEGFVIKSIPIQSIYFRRIKSKIHPFVDTLRFIRFLCTLNNKES
ncbi:MAG: glycosyltransferase family 2 protein [Candidatus Omnitrophica bacterium]|nr:glycosyltransferase family 2 protein [Candidatus Omnitrophota bacterium]